MRTRAVRRLSHLVVAVAMLFGCAIATAPQAAAYSYGNAWIVTPEWAGYCPDVRGLNNYVTGIRYAVWGSGWSDSGGDYGDDRIYPRVQRYQRNHFALAVQCRWTTPQAVEFNIWPSTHAYTYAPRADGSYVHVWW